jgi:hypothetical protein
MHGAVADRMRTGAALLSLLLVVLAIGCDDDAVVPAGDDGARALIRELRNADRPARIRDLVPRRADVEAVFVEDVVDRVTEHYRALAEDLPPGFRADEHQTDVKVIATTSEELLERAPAVEDVPGGLVRIAPYLRPGITIYTWRYVEPGRGSGTLYTGLVHVNGRWVWFAKPWRALPAPARADAPR